MFIYRVAECLEAQCEGAAFSLQAPHKGCVLWEEYAFGLRIDAWV